jgi:four helix bundle protein
MSYRELEVWQRGIELTVAVYEATRIFPNHERYGLASQVQRAVVSVPANIAEGHERDTTKDYLRFVSIAISSSAEVETHLTIAQRLGYLDHDNGKQLFEDCTTLGKMLHALQRSLKRKIGE